LGRRQKTDKPIIEIVLEVFGIETLRFCPPIPEDNKWAGPLLRSSGRMGCEFSFGNMLIWSGPFRTELACLDDFVLTRSGPEKGRYYTYTVPAGRGDLARTLTLLEEDAWQAGREFRLFGLTPEDIPAYEALRPGVFAFAPQRDSFDYVYARKDLAGLSGKKYHQKRNHLAYFFKNNNWSYEPLTRKNLADCHALNNRWTESRGEPEGGAREINPQSESGAIALCFDHFESLGLVGGLLRVDGLPVAYTMGEPLNNNTFCTHVEKADHGVRGAYQAINQLFAEQALGAYAWINREEDLGVEGLRRAKLSYHPAFWVEKHEARHQTPLGQKARAQPAEVTA
jgi:hypothetical protein